jgi:hypothetical protein
MRHRDGGAHDRVGPHLADRQDLDLVRHVPWLHRRHEGVQPSDVYCRGVRDPQVDDADGHSGRQRSLRNACLGLRAVPTKDRLAGPRGGDVPGSGGAGRRP